MSNRIRWQCRRGMLELDFIFQRFFEECYASLSLPHQVLFEKLLQQNDPVLFDWLITGVPCPDIELQEIVQLVSEPHVKRVD